LFPKPGFFPQTAQTFAMAGRSVAESCFYTRGMDPIRGSCLCGGVRFELRQPFRRASHCHCSRCRKHSGTFGETQGRVQRDGFRLLGGEELIRVWRPEDGGAAKAFCVACGYWPDGDEVSVRLGALDDDPGIRPQFHTFVDSRAPWEALPDDGLPRFGGRNPNA
jgi:hypothetical protein